MFVFFLSAAEYGAIAFGVEANIAEQELYVLHRDFHVFGECLIIKQHTY